MKVPRCLSFLVVASVFCSCGWFAMAEDSASLAVSSPAGVNATSPHDEPSTNSPQFTIPGPLRSFLRMAGVSQKISPEAVLPLLSRNVFMEGYQGSTKTEFLILLSRYVVQARELSTLAAASDGKLHVTSCEDAKPLLTILGYRARPNCGEPGTSLQTADSERAFLTIDSGFPLPALERTLQGGKVFDYPYGGTPVPVLFAENDWTRASRKNYTESSHDLIDTIVNDPAVARLYWALSKLDPETAAALEQSLGLKKLVPYAGVLDFYGSRICIRSGRVVVPGGPEAEAAWKDLVGANPESPGTFVQRLLAGGKGWMAAYYDVLSRAGRTQQAYFTEPHRLRLFYEALRSYDPSSNATTGMFRPDPALLVLVNRLQLEPNGEPIVPGDLEVWNEILRQKSESRSVRAWARHKGPLTSPDELVQAMFALSRANEEGPPQIYLTISAMENRRSAGHFLTPATVRLLAQKFDMFSDQYRIFSEFQDLNDTSIVLFLQTAEALDNLPNGVRGNAIGLFQANVGIWQILARQGQIAIPRLNDSWQQMIKPFAKIRSAPQVYNAGRSSLAELFRSATGDVKVSQDELIDLLAGPRQTTAEGMRVHQEIARRIRSVLDGQRLVSLDTVLAMGDALNEKAQGKQSGEFVIRRAGELREFEMPRPMFSNSERAEWAAGIYNNHHTDVEMRTDVAKVLSSPGPSPAQLEEARGQLASFLRDTLVGLNYAYYEPPGAQALHSNPLLVRSHDFAGETVGGIKTIWQAPQLFGQGSPAGGGAHFVGSLADLPYALANLEEDFISPQSVQALIWREMTPALLSSAILPRWWNVTQSELHAVALYQRAGEELLYASANDEELRSKVITILSDRVNPQRLAQVERALAAGRTAQIIPQMPPADTFYLMAEFQRRFPEQIGPWGTASQELQTVCRQHPEQVNWARLSHDFGVPHPVLAQTYDTELLNVGPLPTFMGYSSRLLAESWDSPNLYWARLADENGLPAVALNNLVPQLTLTMIEKVFATDLEDWPALLRAMHETAEEFRSNKSVSLSSAAEPRP